MSEAEPPRRLTAEQCRQQANACRKMMRQVVTPDHRTMLERMAESWERMASDMTPTLRRA